MRLMLSSFRFFPAVHLSLLELLCVRLASLRMRAKRYHLRYYYAKHIQFEFVSSYFTIQAVQLRKTARGFLEGILFCGEKLRIGSENMKKQEVAAVVAGEDSIYK